MNQLIGGGQVADLLEGAAAILSYAGLGLVLLIAGFFAVDVTTPGRLSKIIRADRNSNATLLAGCGMAAVGLIVAASIWGSGGGLLDGLIATAVWGITGVVAQIIAFLIFRALLGIDTGELMKKPERDPAAVLLGVMQLTIGAVTAISVL
jgi:uncharacterized membrane protein YjfL (UPF0719 family)